MFWKNRLVPNGAIRDSASISSQATFPRKRGNAKWMDTENFFLSFSQPKYTFLRVMDTNKNKNTNRKKWRSEEKTSFSFVMNWTQRGTFVQRKTPTWTAFCAINCFVLLRCCIDLVCMVLDCYSKSKQIQWLNVFNETHTATLCCDKKCVMELWSCMAMELFFYERHIPRDCWVMNLWCIKQVTSGKKDKLENENVHGLLVIGENVQNFLYLSTLS